MCVQHYVGLRQEKVELCCVVWPSRKPAERDMAEAFFCRKREMMPILLSSPGMTRPIENPCEAAALAKFLACCLQQVHI